MTTSRLSTISIKETATIGRSSKQRMLEVEHLNLIYEGEQGAVHAVRDVTFSVEEGEFYTLLGPSGCGKTSILRSIAGLERPAAGRIVIGGAAVFDSEPRHGVAHAPSPDRHGVPVIRDMAPYVRYW